MAQPEAVQALIAMLHARGCIDIGVYTGYTLAALRRMAGTRPAIAGVLAGVSWLIDGRFVAGLAEGAPAWRGSRNQRFWRRQADGHFVAEDGVAAS